MRGIFPGDSTLSSAACPSWWPVLWIQDLPNLSYNLIIQFFAINLSIVSPTGFVFLVKLWLVQWFPRSLAVGWMTEEELGGSIYQSPLNFNKITQWTSESIDLSVPRQCWCHQQTMPWLVRMFSVVLNSGPTLESFEKLFYCLGCSSNDYDLVFFSKVQSRVWVHMMLNVHLQTCSNSVMWELVRNANNQSLCQPHCIWNSGVSPGQSPDSLHMTLMPDKVWEPLVQVIRF